MSFVKQSLIAIVAVACAFWGLVTFVPASLPFLDRLGLLAPFGLAVPEGGQGGAAAGGPRRGGGGPVPVIAMNATEANLFAEIETIGDGRALRSVAMAPETSGIIASLNLQSGGYVTAGDVVATLENAVQQIELERATFLLQDAQETADRLTTLGATVPQLQRTSALLALRTAELDLEEAALAMERRRIIAPISGWVGLVNLNVGDQVTPATEIARVDDRSEIVVEFRVPERFVGQMAVGDQIMATPLARPQMVLEGTITALDNRVDPDSRTLRLQASIANKDDVLRAGMAFRINVSFTGEPFASIDPLAIQWDSNGPFVWVVRETKAAKQPILIMQRNSDSVLVSGDLAVGEVVVTEGVQNLRPGSEVDVRGSDTAKPDEAAAPALTRG